MATFKQTPEVQSPSLCPERVSMPQFTPGWKGTMPEGGVVMEMGSRDTITSLNLKENYPGSLGWWGCQNKKHSLTKHWAAQQE